MAFNTFADVKAVPQTDWTDGSEQCWRDLCDFICGGSGTVVDKAAAIRYTHQIAKAADPDDVGVAGGECADDLNAVFQYMNGGL